MAVAERDPVRLGSLGADYGIIAVAKDSPHKTLGEMMDAIKADPKNVACVIELDKLFEKAGRGAEERLAFLQSQIGTVRNSDPTMLRLAGRESDGVVLTWVDERDVATMLPYVQEGNSAAEVVTWITVCPSQDVDRARAARADRLHQPLAASR